MWSSFDYNTLFYVLCFMYFVVYTMGQSRLTLAKPIGEKKQDPSPIWLFFLFFFIFLGLPLVVCILFEDIRVLGLFTGRQ